MKEHIYSEGSWESVTQAIKQHLEIECLTEPLAKRILQMYITGVKVEEIIKRIEGEVK